MKPNSVYVTIYEYDSPMGLHRSFYPETYNGRNPDRAVSLYTAPQPAVPAGWRMVPVEPTQEMLRSVDIEAEDKYLARGRAISAWKSMLEAAPQPPEAAR